MARPLSLADLIQGHRLPRIRTFTTKAEMAMFGLKAATIGPAQIGNGDLELGSWLVLAMSTFKAIGNRVTADGFGWVRTGPSSATATFMFAATG